MTMPGELEPLAVTLARRLATEGEPVVTSRSDALAVVEAIREATTRFADADRGAGGSSVLRLALELLRSVETRDAFEVLRAEGIPPLLDHFDARLASGLMDAGERADLSMLLAVASSFRVEAVVDRVVAAAFAGLTDDRAAWTAILSAYDRSHPFRRRLATALRDPPPKGALGSVYLAFVNALSREGEVLSHPFDTPEGRARILAWLEDRDATPAEYLVAAQALAFLNADAAEALFERASVHGDPRVRVEAFRGLARRGTPGAVDALVALASDPRSFRHASSALRALGCGERIPDAASVEEFQALAELAHWLAHPNELDRPPDDLAVIDTRVMDWPPAGERRRLWLIRYTYRRDPEIEGFGLVGSVTYSRIGEPVAGRSVEDLYALHCVWELEIRQDPRAPEVASLAQGRALLGWN
ncbi:MAG: HEAT repeat domain-containing protein [Isosphaeraceae bacterium]